MRQPASFIASAVMSVGSEDDMAMDVEERDEQTPQDQDTPERGARRCKRNVLCRCCCEGSEHCLRMEVARRMNLGEGFEHGSDT